MFLAAVLGRVGGAGATFAQAPQPMPGPAGGVPAVAAPAVVAPAQPIAAAPAPISGGCCGSAPVIAQDYYGGGCDSCGSSASTKGRHGGLFHRATIGQGCANPIGCGSCASEKTFLFGGCNQFFNPGNKCGGGILGSGCGSSGCGGHGGGCGNGACGGLLSRLRGDCAISPVGTGGLSSPPCTYTSYLNR